MSPTTHPLFFTLSDTESKRAKSQGEERGAESFFTHTGWAVLGHAVPAEPHGSVKSAR